MPTLPAPMTEILVWRLAGEGRPARWMGLKKDWVRSSPPGPSDEDEPLGCILIQLLCFALFVAEFYMCRRVRKKENKERSLAKQWLNEWVKRNGFFSGQRNGPMFSFYSSCSV